MDTREVSKAGDALFKLDGKPTARQAFPLALQHVVAMVVGCVTPAIIIGGIAQRKGEISQADITVLVQSALLIAGISTLIDQLDLLEAGIGNRGLSCKQCVRMMSIYRFDDDKLEVLKILAPNISDRENYDEIINALDFISSEEKARSILGIKK